MSQTRPEDPSHVHDVAIIGAGPIGLELAVALKRRGVDYLHFEARQIGHTVSWWAPQTRWFSSNERISIAGVPLVTPDQGKATREQYLAYLRQVAEQFDLPIRTFEPVTEISRLGDHYRLVTHSRRGMARSHAKRIVLCTGGTDRPRSLGVPGEDLPHVSSYFQEPHLYFRQRLLIVGGRNSAVEAALRCHHAGAKVILSHRAPALPEKSIKYWLLPESNGLIAAGKIQAHFETTPVEITGAHATLEKTRDAQAIRRFDVECDFVLKMIGYEQDNALLKLAGVAMSGPQRSPEFDPKTMETNQPGIYIAGTAVGGTQARYRVFVENCHVHVDRIVRAITGESSPEITAQEPMRLSDVLPES